MTDKIGSNQKEPLSEEDFLEEINEFVKSKGGQKKAAQELNISPQYLNDVLRGRRYIGKSIAEAMGRTIKRVYPRK